MSTDSEVTFRKVLGSSEILPTRPGVDPLEVTRPMADVSWASQSPQATSPSVIIRQPTRTSPGPWPSVASHVFGPSTTQVDPNLSVRESSQIRHQTEDTGPLHWFPHRLIGSAVQSDAFDVSQGATQPTVDFSPIVASSGAVDVDERPSQPRFVVGDARKFAPIYVDVHAAPSSCVDIPTREKRLYAAAHAPLAPPTTPVADLLCYERDILSSSTDSDSDCPPTASQRENHPSGLGTHSHRPSPLSVASSVRSVASRTVYQLTQLATQLVTTVKDQLKSTRDDAELREQRMCNDIAEREHRLLVDAADRDRRTRDEYADREHALLKDAASMRDALLAHDQHARELEAERERRLLDDVRERDLRRDMYDMAAQRSRAAALEAELNCLKANMASSTVAYDIVDVPVRRDDTAPLETTAPLRPVASVGDTAYALISHDADNCRITDTSTSQSPFLSFTQDDTTTCRTDTERTQMPIFAFPQLQPQPPVDPGYLHRSDTLPRQLVAPVAVTDSAHMPSPCVVADRPYMDTPPHLQLRPIPRLLECTVTSALPDQPPWAPPGTSAFSPPTDDLMTSVPPHNAMISAVPRPLPLSRDDVVTSMLIRTPAHMLPHDMLTSQLTHLPTSTGSVPMQRPAARVDDRDVYAHTDDQRPPHLPFSQPPPVHRQVPLLSEQTTATHYVNRDPVPVLTVHSCADTPFDFNYQYSPDNLPLPPLSTHTTVPTYVNVPTHVNVPSSQITELGQSNVRQPTTLHAAPYTFDTQISSSMVAFQPAVYSSYTDGSQRLPIAVRQPSRSVFFAGRRTAEPAHCC